MNSRRAPRPNGRLTAGRERGFTLIEVALAMAITAIGLAGLTSAISQMVDAGHGMHERTYASWIAQNKITEMRLASTVPEVSSTSGEIIYAGREWSWRATVSETGIDALYRVDVEVGLAGSDTFVRNVTGFIGEPIAPGASNRAWSVGETN